MHSQGFISKIFQRVSGQCTILKLGMSASVLSHASCVKLRLSEIVILWTGCSGQRNALLQPHFILMCNLTTPTFMFFRISYHMTLSVHVVQPSGVFWGRGLICMVVGWSWLLSSYTSRWSRDVQVHCIGCCNLCQSLFFGIPTYTCFFFSKELFFHYLFAAFLD